MSVLKGDYIGFSYGINPKTGKPMHSSDLGIVRTSNGSRFDENLLPTMQDKTVPVPGGDGTYYFGSYYTQRQFSVSFAFDSLTEEQVATLKSHFGDKKINDLIFDERPYKIYRAKVTGSATLKYIPFSEGATNRLYKGEGTLQFTCYDPFARCADKWLDNYKNWNNINEWKDASGLKNNDKDGGIYDQIVKTNEVHLYNPGDIETDFCLKLIFEPKYESIQFEEGLVFEPNKFYIFNEENEQYEIANVWDENLSYFIKIGAEIPAGKIVLNESIDRQLKWKLMSARGEDSYVKINTKLNLIEGYRADGSKSGMIYNQYLTEGTFFKIPQGESTLTFENSVIGNIDTKPIEYNYYYF